MADVLTVLKQGMSTEIWGLAFYEQAVAHTKAETGKKIFNLLLRLWRRFKDAVCGFLVFGLKLIFQFRIQNTQ